MPNEPVINTFKLFRGPSYVLRFPVEQQASGDPASGYSTKYTVRTAPNATSVALQASGVWNATTSTIDVAITRAQTLALAAGQYVGSLFRTDAGKEDILSRDTVTVPEGIYDAPA